MVFFCWVVLLSLGLISSNIGSDYRNSNVFIIPAYIARHRNKRIPPRWVNANQRIMNKKSAWGLQLCKIVICIFLTDAIELFVKFDCCDIALKEHNITIYQFMETFTVTCRFCMSHIATSLLSYDTDSCVCIIRPLHSMLAENQRTAFSLNVITCFGAQSA